MWAGTRGYHAERKFPAILTDAELAAIEVPVLLVTGTRSALLTAGEARARGSVIPDAEVAIVPGSHGGFSRIDALNDQIAAFIETRGSDGSRRRRPGALGEPRAAGRVHRTQP